MPVLVVAVQNAVEHRDLGVATSSGLFFRSMGGSFGTAIFGAIVFSGVSGRLAGLISENADLDVEALSSSPATILALPDAIRDPAVQAFSDSITEAFLWAVPCAALAFILTLLLPELPLRNVAHVGAATPDGDEPQPAGVEPVGAPLG
jgi:hypothetical protein